MFPRIALAAFVFGAACAPPPPASAAGLTPRPLRPSAPTKDYDAHVRVLQTRLPHADFAIVVEPPFVVVGNLPRTELQRHAERTVRWAVKLLKKEFFRQEPSEILDIWLFRDAESYQQHALELFGEAPTTPFGYYSPKHRALVMNIATGGGTLVHEIVHPFVRANFPRCPAWLNEGLGSLYEQSTERNGRIVGLPNWRLRGLQEVIRAGELQAFEELVHTSDAEFYGDDKGTNYGQARYLCYWLQEHGLLVRFWHAAVKGAAADPSGWQALIAVLGREDLEAFQREWEEWVLELRYH